MWMKGSSVQKSPTPSPDCFILLYAPARKNNPFWIRETGGKLLWHFFFDSSHYTCDPSSGLLKKCYNSWILHKILPETGNLKGRSLFYPCRRISLKTQLYKKIYIFNRVSPVFYYTFIRLDERIIKQNANQRIKEVFLPWFLKLWNKPWTSR